jgi:PAS domain S-box-containing protein
VNGQPMFSIWMLVCSYWSICNAFELMGTILPVKLFWANMQYASYSFFPVCLFILIAQLTGLWPETKLQNVVLLMIIPIITTVLVWFDEKYGLVRYGFSLKQVGSFSVITKSYGPWFYVHSIYTYGFFFASLIILSRSVVRQKNSLYRKQQWLLLVGILVVFIPNIMYVTKISLIKTFDITPVFFCVTGIQVFIGMVKYRFLNLVPVAHEQVFERMGEGIIVVSKDGKVLDSNSRARELFSLSEKDIAGMPVKKVVPVLFPNTVSDYEKSAVLCTDKDLCLEGKVHYYERNCTLLTKNSSKKISGWIYGVNDITTLHSTQQQVFQQQQQLAISAEQQRVARDLHDNIGQILSFAGIQIQTIQRELEKGNTELAAQYLKKLKEVTDQSYAELRTYIFNLRQPTLQNIPFEKMLSEFAEQISSNLHISCKLQLPEKIPSFFESAEVKSHLFSLTKEAANNCIKHACASEIIFGIQVNMDKNVLYYIQDNGKGIASYNSELTHSSGLRIMEERALLTGGRLSVTSEPESGTKITVIYDGERK